MGEKISYKGRGIGDIGEECIFSKAFCKYISFFCHFIKSAAVMARRIKVVSFMQGMG